MKKLEFQRCLDGTVEPVQQKSLLQLLSETEACSDIESSERVRLVVINHPKTQAFIRFAIPAASTREEAHEAFVNWLYSIPAFESFARANRMFAENAGYVGAAAQVEIPDWYQAYLATEYWQRMRARAFDAFKCCVICGCRHGKLDTHHRTYLTLGNEKIWDVSLLCDRCHEHVHKWLKMCFPSECPAAVLRILEMESSPLTKGATP